MRTLLSTAMACMALLGAAGVATAQNAPTTVQLPTFSFFTVRTSVLVPDSGGSYLGGMSSGSYSSTSRGQPFWSKSPWFSPLGASRGISSGVDAGGVSVHATIIDREELEKAVLSEPAARTAPPSETELEAARLSLHTESDQHEEAAGNSVAVIRRQQAAEDARKAQQAASLLAKAKELEAANKPGQARIYYRMASRHASDELKREIAERMAALK